MVDYSRVTWQGANVGSFGGSGKFRGLNFDALMKKVRGLRRLEFFLRAAREREERFELDGGISTKYWNGKDERFENDWRKRSLMLFPAQTASGVFFVVEERTGCFSSRLLFFFHTAVGIHKILGAVYNSLGVTAGLFLNSKEIDG